MEIQGNCGIQGNCYHVHRTVRLEGAPRHPAPPHLQQRRIHGPVRKHTRCGIALRLSDGAYGLPWVCNACSEAEPAHFWEDEPLVLAGCDKQSGGTWLGVSPNGRFGFLTNYRELQASLLSYVPSTASSASL